MKLRILIAGLMFGIAALAAETGAELFQRAVTQERAAGNLEEAIKLYQRVAKEFSSDRALAAKALVAEARCYEKLGQDKAVRLYEQVAREFGDQPDQVTAARGRLAALGSPAKAKGVAVMTATQIPLPATAGVSWSDGRHVFYSDLGAGGLIAAKMDGSGRHLILPLPATRERGVAGVPSVSPDGKYLAVNLTGEEKASFVIAAVDGSGVREIYQKPVAAVLPVGGWSPDGAHFLGRSLDPDGSRAIVVLSIRDNTVQKIPMKSDYSLFGKEIFSPDGKHVVFGVRRGASAQSNLHIIGVDGGSERVLVDHPSNNRAIDFAPDGKHLLFQSDRSGSACIYALAVSNGAAQGEPVLVKQEAGMFAYAELNKDGTLFYSLGEQAQHEIFTVKLDAAGMLAGDPQVFAGPSGMTPESGAWSPDGQKLAYLSGRDHMHSGGIAALTIRSLASGKEVEYQAPPSIQAIVGWSADGRGIYTVNRNRAGENLELRSVSADTGADTPITSFALGGARVVYSVRPAPEGNALLIAYGDQPPAPGRPARLVRLDPRTGQQTEIIPVGVVSEMTLSPDGTRIAALDRGPSSAKLIVKPVAGGEWRTLATLEGTGYMYLHWMPDGSLIFGKEGFPNSMLFRISASGGAPGKIGELPFLNHVHEIRVHPDGKVLLFQSYVTHTELWALQNFLPKELTAH